MQLVLFVVVLILPAFQSGGFLSATGISDCVVLIIEGGNIECRLRKFDYLDDYNPHTCQLECKGGTLPLPNGVCIGNKVPCTDPVRNILNEWKEKLENTKTKLINEWCRSSQGK
uniref:Putative secreted WC salivary protein n=1 Tax=Ixodes scapularis TaxID=6945 RepID=Q4PN86_IXOSC|nr:putative secreted WC salivary protein [Ixodes scapularis]